MARLCAGESDSWAVEENAVRDLKKVMSRCGLRSAAAVLCIAAGSAGAQVVDTKVPLNYNWHGMARSGEVVTVATPSNADVIGYRAISDRGLYFEAFDPDSLGGAQLVSATGITYGFFDTAGYGNATDPNAAGGNFDLVHLGARGPWYRNWDVVGTTNAGPQPSWVTDPSGIIDHTGLQTTVLSAPVAVDAATEIGVLYTVSDSGGQFDCILTFWNGSVETNVPVRLNAPDWFGNAADPALLSPFVTFQKKLAHTNGANSYTTFRAVSDADAAKLENFSLTNAGPNLNVIEAVISVPRMTAAGISVAGQQLTKVSFGNAQFAPLTFTTISGTGATATVTTSAQTYIAGQPIVVTGVSPNAYNYVGPLTTVVSGTQFSYPSLGSGATTAQIQLNHTLQITTLTGVAATLTSTATTASAHGLAVGDFVTISGASQGLHNGRFRVATVPSATQFTFMSPVNGSSSAQRQLYRIGRDRGYMIYSVTTRTGQPANSTPGTAQQVFAGDTVANNAHAFGAAPTACGVDDTSAVWYSYTASNNGNVEVRTCGAGFDTTLAVYTSGLSVIDCNDNGCGFASRSTFETLAGSTYLIRVAGRAGATGNFTLHIDDPAHVDITMPLQFNWNGICHGPTEQTVTTPVAHENRSDLNGYRAIADRGLLCDGIQSNALNFGGTIGYEGMIYNVYSTTLQSDMIHLGDRALAAGGLRNWSIAGTTWPPSASNNGLRPAWLNQDSQPSSTSSMSSLNAMFGPSTQVGVLYHMANGGASFGSIDMTLDFIDGSVTVTLDATDWFESNATAMPAARTGVLLQRKTGPWRAVQNTDRADDAGVASGRLWVNEAVVSTSSLQALGFDANGRTLQAITFGNVRSAPNGAGNAVESAFGVFAATLRDPDSYIIDAGPGGVGTLTPNQLVVGGSGKMTVAISRGTGSPNNITSVVVDASTIGLGNISLNDSGANGDTTPNDNVFSRSLAFPVNTTPGTVILPFTVTDAQARTATGNIIFTMTLPSGTITPNPVRAGDPALVTMVLPSNGNIASVSLDLAQVAGTTQGLNDSGVNGDVTAADGTWSANFVMPIDALGGTYTLPLTVTDVSSNSATGSASIQVIAPPGNATNLGTLANGITVHDDSLNTAEVKWLKLTIASDVGGTTFLDIDTEGSAMTPTNDTELGLYDSNGNLVATDDDDGSGLLTALSFGAASPARPLTGGVAHNGRDGATLTAGTYYLAYAGYNSVFNATAWDVTSPSTYSGPVRINFSLGTVPTGGLPASFVDLGIIGTNPVVGNGSIAAAGETQWFKFEVPSNIASVDRTYLDIDTEGSSIGNTVIGLFRDDGSGTLVSTDDEDGSGSWSQLSYGRGTRNAPGDGLAYNGRDGATFPAGTYYLAVTEATAAFGNNFIVFFNTGTSTGPVTVNIGRGTMPAPTLTLIAGPINNPVNNSNYYLYDRTAGGVTLWTDAEAFAVSLGGHLASIADADENEFVRSQVLQFGGVDRRGWIGLNDAASINNYVWSDGSPVTYTNWNAGEPNHAGGIEFYAEMLSSNGAWNDQDNDGVAAPGEFTVIEIAGVACPGNECGSQDYNGDGDFGTDQDIEAFFACLGGNCCATCFCQGSDFNGDGDFGTDQDIEAFFRVLGGGNC